MPRTRDLKPGFFKDEDLGCVCRDARLLYAGLWTLADRRGVLEDRPLWIKAELFPYDADADVEAWLQELARDRKYSQSGGAFIVRYQAAGKRYIWVRNLKNHQSFHPKELASNFPAPAEAAATVGEPPQEQAPARPVTQQPTMAVLLPTLATGKPEQDTGQPVEEGGEPEQSTGESPIRPSEPSKPSSTSKISRTDSTAAAREGPCDHAALRGRKLTPGRIPVCPTCDTEVRAAPNPLVAGRRPELEAEGWRLIRDIAAATGANPEDVLEQASTGFGKYLGNGITRLDMATDDRLLRTIGDLRAWLARLEADGTIPAPPPPARPAASPDALEAWDRVLQRLQRGISVQSFATWLRPTEGFALDADRLTVTVPSAKFVTWLVGNYRKAIDKAMRDEGLAERRLELVVRAASEVA